jgi:hypothetical protein
MNIRQKLTMRSSKYHSKQVENTGLEEETIPTSKLNGVVGAVELPHDFDEEIELHDYFGKKHL